MAFNIRCGSAPDGANAWAYRKVLTLARMTAFAPDLLGLQECRDDEQAAFLKQGLPGYAFHGVRREGGGATALEMAPALVRQNHLQVLRHGHFWLSETPQIVGSKSWDSAFARTVTWLDLKHIASGHTLLFLNTHFDYQPAAIDQSARLLRQWIQDHAPDHPLVLTGDFNAEKNSAAHHELTARLGLRDAFRQAHPTADDDGTFHAFGQRTPAAAIDWILTSPHFDVLAADIDRTSDGALFPSDHYPLTAVLAWR